MYRLHELLRHHPAYLIGRLDPLSDVRPECRPIIDAECRWAAEFDEPAWRFADAAAAVLVALAAWGLFLLTIGPPGGSPRIETIAESGDAVDRSR